MGIVLNRPRLPAGGRKAVPGWRVAGVALLAICVVFVTGCKSGPPPEPATEEDLFIRTVSEFPGFSKTELFEGAKIWMGGLSSDIDVIQYANRDLGTIVGKSSFPHSRKSRWGTNRFDFRFTVTVETKDGRLRTTFSEMALVAPHGYEEIRKSDMEAIELRLMAAVDTLAALFQQEPPRDDW